MDGAAAVPSPPPPWPLDPPPSHHAQKIERERRPNLPICPSALRRVLLLVGSGVVRGPRRRRKVELRGTMNLFGRKKPATGTDAPACCAHIARRVFTCSTPPVALAESLMPVANPRAAPQPCGTLGAIAKLRDATETLDKRQEHLNRKIENEVRAAAAGGRRKVEPGPI